MTTGGPTPVATTAADRASILIVDDRPDKLLVLKMVLEDLGAEIVTAVSGEEALKRVLVQDFAVILLDVNMPGLDGLETAQLIRTRRKSAHTPIIFVTADFHDEPHLKRGYALGAVDYIGSPVVPEILRAKVKVFVDLFVYARQAERQALQHIALVEERAARVSAERSTQRQAFLARASAALAGSLDVDATIREIGRLVVPQLADVAIITIVGADGESPRPPQYVSGAGHDGDANRMLGEPLDAALQGLIDEAAVTGVAQRLPRGSGDERYALPDGQSAHALAALPLAARGRPIAVLALAMTGARRLDVDAMGLAGDVAARASAALENALLYRQIQESDQRKNEFLAMLAHELRNPLAPIANAVHVLRASGDGNDRVGWARDVIGRQLKQLTRLVDDLLDLSRITRGKIDLKVDELDAADVLHAAVETCRPLVDAQKHALEVRLPDAPIAIRGDFARMAQVFGNLINNAAKYTEPGGRIDVDLTLDRGDAVFRVRDSGMGIPASQLATVFEPFTQLDRTLDRSQGGLGIGLTLVRRLVEMQGGSVAAHSAGSGQGSEFVVRLPAIDASKRVEEQAVASGAGDRAGAPPHAKTVLVVDDNPDVAESTAILLRVAGYEVQVVLDGKAALDAVDRHAPHAVLLDIGLPGMDGYQVAARMRERPALARTLIVAVTGYGQDEHQARSKLAGVDHHLVKPIDLDAVVSLLAAGTTRAGPGARGTPHGIALR